MEELKFLLVVFHPYRPMQQYITGGRLSLSLSLSLPPSLSLSPSLSPSLFLPPPHRWMVIFR
jgi:hypothetical protein